MSHDRVSRNGHRQFKNTLIGPHVLSREGYDLLEKKLLDDKRMRLQEEEMLIENKTIIDNPPSPIQRHVNWKVAHTKRYGHMTSQSAQEISNKIVS